MHRFYVRPKVACGQIAENAVATVVCLERFESNIQSLVCPKAARALEIVLNLGSTAVTWLFHLFAKKIVPQ
jgi:hypothetical protein